MNNLNQPEEINFKEIVLASKVCFTFLKKYFFKIIAAGFIGGLIGFFLAYVKPVTYTAKTIFVVEDAKNNNTFSGLASLAGQFGVDMAGGVGGGLIEGDNILFYFKSELLAREVLLSSWDSTGYESIANIYAKVYGLNKDWENNPKIGVINFPIQKKGISYSRVQDSLLRAMIMSINENMFNISKVDKKSSFIQLRVTMLDEMLTKRYCDKILAIAINRYISLKTERQKNTIDKLQYRVDSIGSLLQKKTNKSAAIQTSASTIDANPLYKTSTVLETEITLRDKALLSTLYSEVLKNLEIAKFTLSQETPVIQVVDKDEFPLAKNKISKIKYSIYGFLVLSTIFIFSLVVHIKIKSINV
ncbi:hypothetical protein [Sediminibacterium sp. TEGAF015]|uniref:hypothetical protein n=1 Tax=Sediminibacterium sp. TEGAF015 TaxID=575378 RepID=UPI0022017862|nr:hypothetical protein [Sediminibacterium sp. TEGAF015]BDQ13326.1 hypothetical protein TEGAF0_25430 [Sediminibacterium sp. TEGAF015]